MTLLIPPLEYGENKFVSIQDVKLYEWDLSKRVYDQRREESKKNGMVKQDNQNTLKFLEIGPIILQEMRDFCERPDESIRYVQRVGSEIEILFDMIRDEPYNVALLEAASCVLQSRLLLNPVFNPEKSEKIGEGQNAAVFQGTLKELDQLVQNRENDIKPFIVKTVENADNHSKGTLINEAIAAMYISNKLRKNIPTFMYVYASFFEKQYKDGKLFKGPERVLYSLVESIYGIPLHEWLERHVKPDWEHDNKKRSIIYEIAAQVILALQMLREKDKYASHGDLHTNNIYIQQLDREYKLKFSVGGGEVYITTQFLIRIIDLGQMTGRIPLQNGNEFKLGSDAIFLRLQRGIPNTLFDLTFFLGSLSGTIFQLTSQSTLKNNSVSPISAIGIEWLAQLAAPQNWTEQNVNPGLLHVNRFMSWLKCHFFCPIGKNIDLLKFFVNSLHETSKINSKFNLNVNPQIQIVDIQYMNDLSKVSYGKNTNAPLFSCASSLCTKPDQAIKGKK